MENKSSYCIVLNTCAGKEEAESIAKGLIEQRLAACVQIFDIKSFYKWNQKLQKDDEVLLVIKTKNSVYNELEKYIKEHHSYDIPEIVKVPLLNGYRDYLLWIDSEVK
jgi:periplasmic divalent cation tolerance protein